MTWYQSFGYLREDMTGHLRCPNKNNLVIPLSDTWGGTFQKGRPSTLACTVKGICEVSFLKFYKGKTSGEEGWWNPVTEYVGFPG